MAMISTMGGASGAIFGTLFRDGGKALAGKSELDAAGYATFLRAACDGVTARGKAKPGDKTMVDALTPAVDALDAAVASGASEAEALAAAAQACAEGRDATIPLVARKGRASYLGERSADHQDPGATSVTMLLESAARTLA